MQRSKLRPLNGIARRPCVCNPSAVLTNRKCAAPSRPWFFFYDATTRERLECSINTLTRDPNAQGCFSPRHLSFATWVTGSGMKEGEAHDSHVVYATLKQPLLISVQPSLSKGKRGRHFTIMALGAPCYPEG